MMDDQSMTQLTALIGMIGAIAVAYGRALGATQMQLVQWVIDALALEGRYRGMINLLIGVVLAMILSGVVAWITRDHRLFAIGLLAGIIASVEAAQVHDRTETD